MQPAAPRRLFTSAMVNASRNDLLPFPVRKMATDQQTRTLIGPVATWKGTIMRDYRDAKLMARTLKAELAHANLSITHAQALELVAKQLGLDHWNILAARIAATETPQGAVDLEPPIPIFRIFDVGKAMEFYCDLLGFTVDFEHRF
eukprot:gene45688-61874_t